MYLRISFKSQMLGRGVGVHAFCPSTTGKEDAQAPIPRCTFFPVTRQRRGTGHAVAPAAFLGRIWGL